MSDSHPISPRALLVATIVAFAVGMLGSLAVRPPGEIRTVAGEEPGGTGFESVRWRITSSFTSVMPVIGSTPLNLAEDLGTITGGAIQLEFFEPGEVVPAFEITEAVRDGKIEAGVMWVGYDQGRIPASTLISAVPFGMEPMEFAAWWYHGGGQALGEALYHEHNVHPILCAIVGPETAGWFREPITSLDDLKGLKIRFAGIGGKILQRLGASVTMIPGGEIFQALEKGAIDASEFSLPVVDRMLGFGRVAKYNYFPGWHQTYSTSHLMVNLDEWQALRPETRRLVDVACMSQVAFSYSEGEAVQGDVIRKFPEEGVSAVTLPDDILRRLQEIAQVVLDEEASQDAHFAKILQSQRAFSETYRYWKTKGYLPRDF